MEGNQQVLNYSWGIWGQAEVKGLMSFTLTSRPACPAGDALREGNKHKRLGSETPPIELEGSAGVQGKSASRRRGF